MPLSTYTARDGDGKSIRGSIEAFSAQAARDTLREMDLQAEEIYEVPEHLRDPDPVEVEAPKSPAWMTTAPARPPVLTHEQIVADHIAIKQEQLLHPRSNVVYFPLLDTLRLYAGWLLSWYFLIFAFGSYAYLRELPWSIPLVSGLFQSPVIISFAFGAFLFLLLTELHRILGKGKWAGLLMAAAWFGVFVLFRMNM
ncbi:hypothetical protein HYZ99_05735 [Candidatus Peregrinibacteria bacterium]|nr:hypothetical protein [Candidatus Peregrinibacteria bacterium]